MRLKNFVKPGKLVRSITKNFVSFSNIGRPAVDISSTIKNGIPSYKSIRVMKRAAYKGQGIFSKEMKSVLRDIGKSIGGMEIKKLRRMPNLGASPDHKLQEALVRKTTDIKRRTAGLFFGSSKYQMDPSETRQFINSHFKKVLPSGADTNRVRGTIMSGRERAMDTIGFAENTKELLKQAKLASNTAVMSIPRQK